MDAVRIYLSLVRLRRITTAPDLRINRFFAGVSIRARPVRVEGDTQGGGYDGNSGHRSYGRRITTLARGPPVAVQLGHPGDPRGGLLRPYGGHGAGADDDPVLLRLAAGRAA